MKLPNKQNLASRTKDLFSTMLIVTIILYISIKLFLKASFEEKCYICNPDGVFANYGLTCLYHTLTGFGGGNINEDIKAKPTPEPENEEVNNQKL